MRRIALSVALAVALSLPASAAAAVRRVAFTGTVDVGDYASLTVAVSPTARCTIKVVYDTTVSHARGLAAKRGGKITWRWRVGTNTHLGRWPVTVNCGGAGKLSLRLRVTR